MQPDPHLVLLRHRNHGANESGEGFPDLLFLIFLIEGARQFPGHRQIELPRVSVPARFSDRRLIEPRRRLVLDVRHVRVGGVVDSRLAQIRQIGLVLLDLVFHAGQTQRQRRIAMQVEDADVVYLNATGLELLANADHPFGRIVLDRSPDGHRLDAGVAEGGEVVLIGPIREHRSRLDTAKGLRLPGGIPQQTTAGRSHSNSQEAPSFHNQVVSEKVGRRNRRPGFPRRIE